MNNLELAKKKEYLPFSKKFVESITFSTFFDCFDVKAQGMSSMFLNLINPPNKIAAYTSKLTIEKLKNECSKFLVPVGEKICMRHFKESDELSFWYNILEISQWLSNFKKTFPDVYNEFIINCEQGNPLQDFYKYLTNYLKYKQGENVIVQAIYFKTHSK